MPLLRFRHAILGAMVVAVAMAMGGCSSMPSASITIPMAGGTLFPGIGIGSASAMHNMNIVNPISACERPWTMKAMRG